MRCCKMTETCDLCNEKKDLIEGTFFKRSDHGGVAMLCDECWSRLDRPRCALCGTTELPDQQERRHSIAENVEEPRGGPVCGNCREVLDWNRQ